MDIHNYPELTDAQLRATPVPISGTVAVTGAGDATAANQTSEITQLTTIAGKDFATQTTLALIKAKTDNIDVALSTRTKPADTQAISASALPLPAGASTEATLALIKAKTDNIDVALSTRTKPADAQHTIIDSGTVTATVTGVATETTLAAINTKIPASPSAEHTTAASPNSARLSDGAAFYKATTPSDTQPVSAASLPLPSGASTSAKQDTGNTSVASIDTKTPALGQALAASSVPVVLTAAQITTLTPLATVAITAASLPLPTGAATDTSLTTITNRLDTILASNASIDSKMIVDNTGDVAVKRIGTAAANMDVGSGASSTGTQRVILATDQAAVPVSVAASGKATATVAEPAYAEASISALSQTLAGRLRVDLEASSQSFDGEVAVRVYSPSNRRIDEIILLEMMEQSYRNFVTSENSSSCRYGYEVR